MANEIIENAGIITVDGGTNTVLIGDVIYTGSGYSQDRINNALNNHGVIAAQGVSYTQRKSLDIAGKTLLMDQTTVADNYANFGGGAIYNEKYSGTVAISGSTFSGNTAANHGGAIYSNGTVLISDSIFSCNVAVNDYGHGGAFFSGGAFTISGSTFSANTIGSSGGAVYNEKGNGKISCSVFSGNTARIGGAAVYCSYSSASSVEITDCVFLDNVSKTYGGAVHNSGNVKITGSTFYGNSGGTGGAIYSGVTDSVTEIYDSCFLTVSDSICTKGTLIIGGTIKTLANITSTKEVSVQKDTGLFIDLSALETSEGMTEILTGYDTMFAGTNNTQQNLSITVNVSENACGHYLLATGADKFDTSVTVVCDAYDEPLGTLSLNGPASFVQDGKYYALSRANGNVTLTIVQDLGIVTSDSSIFQVEIDGTTYSGRWYGNINTALGCEETVVAQGVSNPRIDFWLLNGSYNDKKLIADHITISNTWSDYPGGAIDLRDNGILEITGSTFFNNTAGSGGGAIRNTHTSATIKNVLFLNNHAPEGGAIASYRPSSGPQNTTIVTGCTFSGNVAGTGGAIQSEDGMFLLTDSYFLTPTDTIYVLRGEMTIGGTIWTAANITIAPFGFEKILEDTKFILDLSAYQSADRMKEFLTKYDRYFSEFKSNFSISVHVAADQIGGRYLLASEAASFDKTITVICDAYDEPLGTLSLTDCTEFCAYGKRYVLDNTNGTLSLSVSIIAGIVSPDDSDRQVVIDNQTYSGEWYADIESAFVHEDLVAAKGISCGRIEVAGNKQLVIGDISLSGNSVSTNGGAIYNSGDIKIANCTFFENLAGANGGAVANSGVAVITGCTFSGNTAATQESGAFYNTGTATIRDSIFATATDTICNDNGTLTLGGTIKTAAKITSANALTILPEMKLVLDISGYQTAAEMAPLLSAYNTAFSPAQENLTVSVAVAFDQAEGSYTLAADAGNFDRSITVTCDAYAKPLGTLSLNGGTEFSAYGRRYLLENNGDLTLTIIESRGIVTPDSSDHHVVVGGTAYTGTWYSDIATALANKDTVIAQGINSTRFEIDKAGKSLRMDQTTVSDHVCGKYGAGFKNDGGNISVTDSVFAGNTATWSGGAVYNSGTVSISDSTFSGNTAGWDGGAVYNSGTVSISGSTFSGNSAMGDGGAVYNDYSCIMTISDSVFSGNTAMGDGGAFCNYSHATATISDSVFSGNAAESGGAVFNCGIVTISDSVFSGNSAMDDGGAFCNYSNATATISDSVFSGNAAESGGAVYNDYSGIMTISGSTFSGNSAWYDGGAIYNTGTATIENSVFETATDTIYNDGGTLVLGGTIRTAANITADKEVAVQDDTELIVDLSSYTTSEGVTEWFTGYDRMFGSTNNTQQNFSLTVNVSDETYGAYVLATGADKFDKTITVVCDAYDEPLGTLSLADTTSFTSHGKYCTLSRANGNVTLTIVQDQGIVTPDRSIIQVEIDGKNYSGRWYNSINTALQSEVTVVAQGVNKSEHVEVGLGNRKLIADHIVISKAETIHVFSGGAINTVDSAVMEITGSTFSENGKYVQRDGGAICSRGTTTIKNSLFIQNNVDDLGGGLYCIGTTEVVGSTFSSNHAYYGAGIYNEGNAIITGCVFLNNHGDGGGVCNYASATVSGCTFSGNSASRYDNGGAIKSVSRRDASANITVSDCYFLTALDSICCTDYAVMTLGGTIWTAAQIYCYNGGSIRVESDTDLILDVSVSLPGATETAVLYGYDEIEGASENLSITVNIAQEQAVGIYRLVANASKFDGTITLDIENESVASLDFITKVVLGERAYRLNRHEDYYNNDVQLVVEDVSNTVIFGGTEGGDVSEVQNNTNLTLLAGTFSKSVFAGNKIQTTDIFQALSVDSSLDILDGSYSAYVMGGDYLSTTQENVALINTTGSRILNISGGTFDGLVAGGSYLAGEATTLVSQLDGDISVTISGGTFNKRIYGGDITDKMANSTTDIINGNISFTLDASDKNIQINESIVCGSYGYGTVKGDVVFTVMGSGKNLTFADYSVVNGGSGNGYLKTAIGKLVKEYDNFLNGTSKVVFDGYSGDFTARLALFDAISFDNGAEVSLTNAKCNLAELSFWQFADRACVNFCDGQSNDFTGDALDIDLTGWDRTDEWTLATGSTEDIFHGFDKFGIVMFGDTEAHYDIASAKWVAGDITLSLSESGSRKSMVLAQVY